MKTFKRPEQNKNPLNSKSPLHTQQANSRENLGNQNYKKPLKGQPLNGKRESDQKGW